MKRFSLAITLFLICVIVFGILVLLDSLFDKRETKTNLFFHYYSIKPESLLEALNAGKFNAFSLSTEEPPSIPPDQQVVVPWTQGDYLHIANALYEFARGETLSDWQLHTMDLALSCGQLDIGFQEGNFEFFKNAQNSERESRRQLIININPKGNYVFITENEYYPKLVDWGSIDLGKNQLSANEILRIAENAGGQAKRLSVHNNCNISIWLSPDSASYKGWVVHYYPGEDGKAALFQVNVDPTTGEVYTR